MPIEFIKSYGLEVNTNWDIMLATGNSRGEFDSFEGISFSKEFRKMIDKGGYIEANQRHISTGSLESVLFSSEECRYKTRKDLRAMMEKPLLLLHVMDIKVFDSRDRKTFLEEFENVPAFGISFPGDVNSDSKIIKAKINRVYVEQLINDIREESESDD